MILKFKKLNPLFLPLTLATVFAAGCGSGPVPAPVQVSTLAAQAAGPACQSMLTLDQPGRQTLADEEVMDGAPGAYRLVSVSILATTYGNPSTVAIPGAPAPAPMPVNPGQPLPPSYINFQALVASAGPGIPGYAVTQACQNGTRDAFGTGYLSVAMPELIRRADGTIVTQALTFQMGPTGPLNQSVSPLRGINTMGDFELRTLRGRGADYRGLGDFDSRASQYRFYRGVTSGVDLVTVTTRDLGLWPMTVTSSFHYEAGAAPQGRPAYPRH